MKQFSTYNLHLQPASDAGGWNLCLKGKAYLTIEFVHMLNTIPHLTHTYMIYVRRSADTHKTWYWSIYDVRQSVDTHMIHQTINRYTHDTSDNQLIHIWYIRQSADIYIHDTSEDNQLTIDTHQITRDMIRGRNKAEVHGSQLGYLAKNAGSPWNL